MYAWREGLYGRGGLGDAETATECPQPVSTAERDALRDEIRGWTNPSERVHFVEGHPDVGAVYDDIVNRLRGLEQRPKLLRCEKEARDRAHTWIGQLVDLGWKVRSNGPYRGGFTRVLAPFEFTVFRGPTYTLRPLSSAKAEGSAPVSSAPPGSVVVGGQVYESSSAAAAATGAAASESSPASSGTVTPTTSGTIPIGAPWLQAGGGGSLLEGSVFGVPTRYLVFGGLALVAWRMMKGR